MKRDGVLKYELLLLLLSIIWGGGFAAQQIGMQKGVGPMTFNALRFALGAIAIVPVMAWRQRVLTGPDRTTGAFPMKGSLIAGFFLFAAAGLQQVGLQFTSSANSGFITSLYVLFVPLIGLRLRIKTAGSLWIGILICLSGFYLLSVTDTFRIGRGDVLTLACAVLWACQILVIDRIAGQGDPIKIACLEFAVCALLSALAAVTFESVTPAQINAAAGAIAYAGLGSVGIAFTLQVICQKRCPAAPAAIIMSLEAVFAALAGYLILDQRLTTRGIIGCALILAGVLFVQCVPLLRKRNPPPRST